MNFIKLYGFSSNALKIIAMISMVIDHIGFVFFPQCIILRYIGRIAFPIYCFLLVEGFFYTHNVYKYMARLFSFAIISEIPFNLGLYNTLIYTGNTNVFFTLFIGLAVIFCAQVIYRKTNDRSMGMICAVVGMVLAYKIRCDYSYTGILMIYVFYLMREGRISGTEQSRNRATMIMCLLITMIMLMHKGYIENYGVFALVFILLYSGKKTGGLWDKLHMNKCNTLMKYVFYAFYPVHLFVIYILRSFV